jgi:hypothetical protein
MKSTQTSRCRQEPHLPLKVQTLLNPEKICSHEKSNPELLWPLNLYAVSSADKYLRACLVAGHRLPRHARRRHRLWRGKRPPRSVTRFLLFCMQMVVVVLIYSCAKHLPDFLWHASLLRGKLWPGAKQTLKFKGGTRTSACRRGRRPRWISLLRMGHRVEHEGRREGGQPATPTTPSPSVSLASLIFFWKKNCFRILWSCPVLNFRWATYHLSFLVAGDRPFRARERSMSTG